VKVRVGEKVYEINSLEDMEMDHLIRMQEEAGIGDQTFQRRGNAEMARAQAYAAEVKIAEKEGRAAPDQPDGDMLFMALIVWLARLAAGEDISWADARKVKMRDLEVIPDEVKKADGEVESDPTQPAVKPSASSGRSKRTLAAAS
jgi:hypothetical protein